MTTPATNPLSYNAYIQNLGVMAVALTQETASVSPPWVSSKATSGFSINFSAAFTGTVDWQVRL